MLNIKQKICFQNLLVLALCFFALPGKATAAKYESGRGFSLSYPESWMIVTKGQSESIETDVKTKLEQTAKTLNIDFTKIDLLIFNPYKVDIRIDNSFTENVIVKILPGRFPPLNESELRKAEKNFTENFSQQGLAVANVESRIATLGNNKGISIDYDIQNAGIHQWFVAIPGKGQAYLITSSCLSSQYQDNVAIFRDIVYSLEIDTGFAGFLSGLPPLVRDAILGGIIGLGFGFLRFFSRKTFRA